MNRITKLQHLLIQRTNTTGGRAPAASTRTSGTVGTTADVPYTADYHLWKATGR